MAARTVKIRHDEETRAKIKVSQLLNRLQDHVFGVAEMTQTQIRAAEICLKKAIPDLTYTESKSDITYHYAEVPKTADEEEWQKILDARSGVLNQARKPS